MPPVRVCVGMDLVQMRQSQQLRAAAAAAIAGIWRAQLGLAGQARDDVSVVRR